MAKLTENSYGKSSVRLTKIVRDGPRHDLMEFAVDIILGGDFVESYTTGDNSKIIATDSMKNLVYMLAKESKFASIEEFAAQLARRFESTYRQVHRAKVAIEQTLWQRMMEAGQPHAHAFIDGGSSKRTCCAELSAGKLELSGGVANLRFLKTTGSAFRGFVTDRFRTLPDTTDRIFATSVEAVWKYESESADFDAIFAKARLALINTMADHDSLAVQHTLMAMGEVVLKDCPAIRSIRLSMPNLHRIPVNLEPFGLENNNEIFIPVDEPYGVITGLVERE